jgi:hypothetical protein
LVRVVLRSVSAAIAALGMGVAVKSGAMPASPADAGLRSERPGISVFGTIHPKLPAWRHPVGSQIPAGAGVRLASLDMQTDSAAAGEAMPDEVSGRHASFGARFASAFEGPQREAQSLLLGRTILPSPLAGSARPKTGAPPAQRARGLPPGAARHAPGSPTVSRSASRKPVRMANAGSDAVVPADDSRTAIYDIAARAVYLPNGDKLEAHSGFGSSLDDSRHVSLKGRGPTPPNVYRLTLRNRLFHGVRAIRLIPVGDGEMFGRDGILAHSYMLGPSGQSNGCVSVSNYPAFLNAFLRGEIDRLVVVERLDTAPSVATGLGWLPEPLRKLFKSS